MPISPRILAFGGSLRRDSFNQKLAAIVAEGARYAHAEISLVSLRDYPMPIFDQDEEAAHGMPSNARKLKAIFASHHGLIIAAPEYNSSVSAALKNALDWISRTESDDEKPLSALSGKTAAICAASPGGLGGLRGLVHLRAILGNVGITVLPDQVAIAAAHEAFSPDGSLADKKQHERVKALGTSLARHLSKLLA